MLSSGETSPTGRAFAVQRSPRMFFARAHYFSRLIWPLPAPSALALSSLLKRPFGLVPSIVIAKLAVAELTPLPRRSNPAAPLLAPVSRLPEIRFHVQAGCLRAKSETLGACTNRTRKASRMNTCAKKVGGGRERHGHQELRGPKQVVAANVSSAKRLPTGCAFRHQRGVRRASRR
jgi:hypothetical protein